MRMRNEVLAALGVAVGLAGGAVAQTGITPGNLVVLRVGTGNGTGGALDATATAVSLREYTLAGAAVQTIAVSSGGSTALTLTGNSTTQGSLNLSTDGGLITFGGYRKDAGGANPQSDATATTNRVIGTLAVGTGVVNTNLAVTDGFSADSLRSVVTTNGSSFYLSGAGQTQTGGVRYTAAAPGGAPSTATSTPLNNGTTANQANTRQVQIVNNQLTVSSGAANPGNGVYQVGTGLPTSGTQTYTQAVSTTGQINSFVFARLGTGATFAGTGADTLYAVDGSTIAKFSYAGGAFAANGTVARAGVNNITSAGFTTGGLYGTDGGTLFSFTDTAGFNAAIGGSFTTLATADANTAFRGVVLTPVPEPATVGMVGAALLGAATWVRRTRRKPLERAATPATA